MSDDGAANCIQLLPEQTFSNLMPRTHNGAAVRISVKIGAARKRIIR